MSKTKPKVKPTKMWAIRLPQSGHACCPQFVQPDAHQRLVSDVRACVIIERSEYRAMKAELKRLRKASSKRGAKR